MPAAVAYSIEETWLAGVVAVAGVYRSTLVATHVAVALAAASAEVLEGRNATVGGATAVASARLGAIAGWASSRSSRSRVSGRSRRWTARRR